MPTIGDIDHFDKCMEETTDLSVYCGVITYIKPDRTNQVWNIIEVININ